MHSTTTPQETAVAMHMSDGIIDAPVSLVFGAVALAGVALCAWRARSELDDKTVPMAGLVAAFVFAVQMVNFPILPGVSGHLLGGTLAAILVGPYTGALCVSIVLVVQALLFADGGVTALGANITNMALLGTAVGFAVALTSYRVIRSTLRGVRALGVAAFVASVCGTVAAASGFVIEYALGGAATTSLGTVAGYLWGTHALIGVGEGVITAATVMSVARSRPDLVYLLRVTRPAVPAAVEVSR
ncbi:cobalamin biosynthesis protein CbiM [Gordonia sp. SID5947]|uniref:energy-coupling factor ABC transporter permease n=1 Tax=Gordonia sp. SID5947 TaxID=2690315 RepID=UPI0013716FB3|nr:energy-coupling factor ABC transporter permease [Gordonia sp. SID5947]MYR06075.1 cobalamin biosynthesis protein CbiM [Gordonia sp. SID5947]